MMSLADILSNRIRKNGVIRKNNGLCLIMTLIISLKVEGCKNIALFLAMTVLHCQYCIFAGITNFAGITISQIGIYTCCVLLF